MWTVLGKKILPNWIVLVIHQDFVVSKPKVAQKQKMGGAAAFPVTTSVVKMAPFK